MTPERVLVIGGFPEVLELCEACGSIVEGIVDRQADPLEDRYRIVGTDEDAERLYRQFPGVAVVITPDAPAVRRRLADLYTRAGFRLGSLIHPLARISRSASLGAGVLIQSGVNVSSRVRVGDLVRLNTNANLMHDVTVGSYATIAPDAVLLGRVAIGEGCYIGANATVLPDLAVGAEAVVGAGAVVTRSVPQGEVTAGIPARRLAKPSGIGRV